MTLGPRQLDWLRARIKGFRDYERQATAARVQSECEKDRLHASAL